MLLLALQSQFFGLARVTYMSDSIHFSAIDLAAQNHLTCPLCTENPIEFQFEFVSEARPVEELRGHCCLACAASLLDAMRSLALAEQDGIVPDRRPLKCCSKYVN